MSLYEVPFEYWEWEEPEKTVLQLEHFGMGELMKILNPNSVGLLDVA